MSTCGSSPDVLSIWKQEAQSHWKKFRQSYTEVVQGTYNRKPNTAIQLWQIKKLLKQPLLEELKAVALENYEFQ